MKTALILLTILGMACAFSMKNLHRRFKLEDSEENGVFKYRPRYFLYKHGYFYPPLKRFPVQNSNEEENNEASNDNEDEEAEAENATLATLPTATTLGYGELSTPGRGDVGLAAIQMPKMAGETENKAAKKKESDEEEEEEEENENEESEAEVDENEQTINGTSTNSTEVDNGNGSSGGDNGEAEESVTGAGAEGTTMNANAGQTSGGSKTASSPSGFQPTTPLLEAHPTTHRPFGGASTPEYGAEYEQTGHTEDDNGYEVYDENPGPRGDNYRAYEDEYSYYKGRGYGGYEGQDYYYHQ